MVVPVAAAVAAVDAGGWEVAPEGLLNSEDVGAPVDAAAELAGVLPPPRVGNGDGPEVAVVVAVPPAAVFEAAEVAAVEAGVFPPSLGKLKPAELPPPAALDVVFADENRPLGASEADAADLSPPKPRRLEEVEPGCDAAGAPPRLKVGALLAGVAEGVVLPRVPNKDFDVACVPEVPD